MMLNYEFIGDFIQGMVDMLIPGELEHDDDSEPDTPVFPPVDPGADGDRDEQDADTDTPPRYDNESDSDLVREFSTRRNIDKKFPGGE